MFNSPVKKILLILFFSLCLRIVAIFFFADTQIDKEWGIMIYNLENYKMLSSRVVDGSPVPNLFMPPLYALFLYSIKLIFTDTSLFLNMTIFIQLTLSIVSILLMYFIFLRLFEKKFSLIGTTIYAFFPLNIYAVSQISSITLQMFLINLYLFYFIKIFYEMKKIDLLLFSVISALLILLRGEFFIFVLFSLFYLLLKKRKLIQIFFTTIFIILLITPYLYRNYTIFNIFTITKSTGFNLLKGNNPKTKVEGIGLYGAVKVVVPEVKNEIEKLEEKGPIARHDLEKDQILLDQALKFIKQDPKKYFNLYVKKFLSFFFIDINSSYPNYYSLFHIIPKIFLSIGTLMGIILAFNLKFNLQNYFIIFYLSNIALFSVFFILPRYSLILLPIQLLISMEGTKILTRKFFN
tara:strand:- start:3959 stop:5179 length:1221 start_codon:yes stop_codon:yes gene_type:complete